MSFTTDIKYIMTNDTSLNALTGGIYYEHLPEQADLENDYIVFTYNKTEQTNVFGKRDVISDYTLNVIVISTSPYRLSLLSNMIIDYLNNTKYGGIKEIYFMSENRTKDLDEGIYLNTIEFNSFYNN